MSTSSVASARGQEPPLAAGVRTGLIPVQLSMGSRPSGLPPVKKPTPAPAKSRTGLTTLDAKGLAEVMKRLSPKERKRLAQAMKRLSPEDRKRLADAVMHQSGAKAKATRAPSRVR